MAKRFERWILVLTIIWVLWMLAIVNNAHNTKDCEDKGDGYTYIKIGSNFECRKLD